LDFVSAPDLDPTLVTEASNDDPDTAPLAENPDRVADNDPDSVARTDEEVKA
jgi:hypothetical protein